MDESRRVMAETLFKAIEAERDGRRFYLMAAQSTQDARAREVFTRLADEELGHERFLTAHYQAVLTTGQLDAQARLAPRHDFANEAIFSIELQQRVKEAHFEMSALAIAVQLESGAMQYYRHAASQAPSDAARQFFVELADWEQGHYRVLLAQQESVRGDYWSQNGFQPF